MATVTRCLVRRDTYRDSVELMRVAAAVETLPGIMRTALLMATPANRELLTGAGLLVADATAAGPNDLVVAIAAADQHAADQALTHAAKLLDEQAPLESRAGERPPPRTIAEALTTLPEANLAIISTPGTYATAEALKALKRGLHVFLFSDNVPIIPALEQSRKVAVKAKRALAVVASVCGTAADPQDLSRQEQALADAGVILAPSNAQAARLAASLAANGRPQRRRG